MHHDDLHSAGPSSFVTSHVSSETGGSVSSENDFSDTPVCLPEKLADWAHTYSIPLNALSALLVILHKDHPCLPKDARTLLGTLAVTDIKTVAGGEYDHFGIKSALAQQLLCSSFAPESCISIQVNIDGLPIFKSSGV